LKLKSIPRSEWGRIVSVSLAVVAAVACGGADQTVTPSPSNTIVPATEIISSGPNGAIILAAGELDLSSVNSQEEPGFHQVLTATHKLPLGLGATTGHMLVIKLWDAGRPEGTCSSEHPRSGCATVDWSDGRSRPSVPPGGVFDNSITFEIATGVRSFYLSELGALNDEPDALVPGT